MVQSARDIAQRYGYQEIETPVIESASLFTKTLGPETDVVSKEMYIFPDKSQNLITLRPENTAGVARAFITNHMKCSPGSPLNLFYAGPMFRYERPQQGRSRQFHQIGVESLGDPSPNSDIQVISMAAHLLEEWGLLDEATLEINTLGDAESRTKYRATLTEYFERYESGLSEESKLRLSRGSVLRILDSKEASDKNFIDECPSFDKFLTPQSERRWQEVLNGLELLGIKYSLNPKLVRGLDYYSHTCFEFTTKKLGAQSALIAGGRYDGLIKSMGGPDTPGIGWALGVERIAQLIDEKQIPTDPRPIHIIPVLDPSDTQEEVKQILSNTLKLTYLLRKEKHSVVLAGTEPSKKLTPVGKLIGNAVKQQAKAVLLYGNKELREKQIVFKNLDTEEQISFDENDTSQLLETLHLSG